MIKKKLFHSAFIISLMAILAVVGCVTTKTSRLPIEQQLAQKIMLDLRYYCADMKSSVVTEENNDQYESEQKCRTPLTTLPKELAELIRSTSLGGVILFADNLNNIEQIIKLTSALRNAALSSSSPLPLFISVDQEGGRVVRLPRSIATSFTGNMSIGATFAQHGDVFAKAVGEVLGSELHALGFNVDHAPDVDVNINSDNPVINVRSFGENPQRVADLGIAMLNGMQNQGIIATLKHFPGHGDTNTDSHTGLPMVKHNLATVERVDLFPFKEAIEKTNVEMIMTAHIQYPALDNSIIVNKNGQSMIKPATLSKVILTDLLRNKLGYQGLVITDALDMAGITDFFTPLEAVFNTFKAGADIAMMPMKIRKPADIKSFKHFLQKLSQRVQKDPATMQQIQWSVARIVKLKSRLPTTILSAKNIQFKIKQAKQILASHRHRAVEQALAQNSIVALENNNQSTTWLLGIKKVSLLFPKQLQSNAMKNALRLKLTALGKPAWQMSTASLEQFNEKTLFQKIDQSDLLIVASDSQQTAVELGGVDDLTDLLQMNKAHFGDNALKALSYARAAGKKTLFIALKAPYHLEKFRQYADRILVSFDGSVYLDASGNATGVAINALAAVILGGSLAKGKLPVSL